MATEKTAKKRAKAAREAETVVTKVKADTKAPSGSTDNITSIMVAEFIGTFILALVAITASYAIPLYIGITLALIVMIIGNISGAHVNPAVTFGMWVARKIDIMKAAFYWVAQLLGAMAALLLSLQLAPTTRDFFSFNNFGEISPAILVIEIIGTAVFLFGIVSVTSQKNLGAGAKAVGVGSSLLVAMLISASLFGFVKTEISADINERSQKYQKELADGNKDAKFDATLDRALRAGGATLNPAVAIVATELTERNYAQEFPALMASKSQKDMDSETAHTRFGLESIIGTFIGAGLGAVLASALVSTRKR